MIQWHVHNLIDEAWMMCALILLPSWRALLDMGHGPQCSCKDLTDILISETCPGDTYMDLKQTEFLNSSRLGIEQFSCRLSVDDGDISLRWINGDTVLYNYMVSNSNYFSHQMISIERFRFRNRTVPIIICVLLWQFHKVHSYTHC